MGLARRSMFGHKVNMRSLILPCLMGFVLASCAAPEPVPAPRPQAPVVQPAPQPKPAAPAQPQGHWTDWPTAQGSWVYRRDDRGSIALYGVPGSDALVTLRCDKGRARLFLSRAAAIGSAMTVRTSSVSKDLLAQPTGAQPPYLASELIPTDAILDAMAYSRGRIAIEVASAQSIAIPIWSEVGRVVEDCR
jgi:hypothetical protein